MAYDGTVKIGTELDGSGIKKGIEDINGTAKSGFSKFSEIGKNALSVFAGNMLTEVVSQAKNAAGAVLDGGLENRRYAERHRGYHEPCCSIRRRSGYDF